MAERRMVSKTISTSRKINKLKDRAALLYTWMLPHTDDFGHLEGDAMSLRAKVVPMRDWTMEEIEIYIDEMVEVGAVTRYEADGETYIEISSFNDFQTFRPDRARRAEYPMPPTVKASDIPLTYQRQPDGNLRQRKLSEVKLSKDKIIHVAAKAASNLKTLKKPKKEKRKDDDDPYTREEFIAKMSESNQPHVRWLADYTEEKKPKYETKGQWRDYFNRNVKGAAQIRKYSDEQIEKALLLVEKNRKTKDNPRGYITKWGVETLLKFLDDANEE